MLLVCAGGCGRKGPPLAPLHPVPAGPTGVTLTRAGSRVELRFTLPTENQDKTGPVALDRIEVYAVTAAAGAPVPTRDQLLNDRRLIGTIQARPAEKPGRAAPPEPSTTPPDPRPGAGETTTFVEMVTPAVEAPVLQAVPPVSATAAASAVPPAAPDAAPRPATRYYMLVSVAAGHRLGGYCELLPLEFTPAPAPPSNVAVAYDETTLRVTWAGAPGASFRVYAVDRAGRRLGAGPPTPSAIDTLRLAQPVEFGVERCFAVSTTRVTGAVSMESDPSRPVCTTAVDTFPPPAPQSLSAVPTASPTGPQVSLSWSPVDAADLAGYIVRRGEVTNDRGLQALQAVSERPAITRTQFTDTTVKSGVHYTYRVFAVDKAGNESGPSNAFDVPCCAPVPAAFFRKW